VRLPACNIRVRNAARLTFLTLGVAYIGAWFTPGSVGALNEGVEAIAATGSGFLDTLASLLPLGFAFGAGMVSAVNPCGFAMLPAYLGLFLGHDEGEEEAATSTRTRLGKALVVGGTVTLGFVALFGLVGLLFGLGSRWLADAFPYVGLATGVALVAVGAWSWHGGALYSNLGERLSQGVAGRGGQGLAGYAVFGVGYGLASLSCTLPVFLAVLGSSLTLASLPAVLMQLLLFGAGMGSVILALTLSMALARGALVGRARGALSAVGPASAALMLIAGAYIVYYWLTLGELLPA